jgi:hypothetical protein
LEALKHVDADAILFIEDDDWYDPDYVKTMVSLLDAAPIAGICRARYYNVAQRRWKHLGNEKHASLSMTAITSTLFRRLSEACRQAIRHGDPWIDLRLWGVFPSFEPLKARKELFNIKIAVGIKGMPGRGGIGKGHTGIALKEDDPDGTKLREWIGSDAESYSHLYNPVTA